MKKSKDRSTKLARPATAHKLRARRQKSKAVPAMPAQPVHVTASHAERVDAHQRQLETIQKAYCESTAETFHEPESLAKRKAALRRNMLQLGRALADWHCTAVDLFAEGQHASLLKTLDLKGARWAN